VETYWIRDPALGGQPIVSVSDAGFGVELAEWSDIRGIPAYLLEDHVPGVKYVYFVNGDPREAEWAAARALAARQQEDRRRAEEAAFLLLASD